jgi:hypothetical protein
VLDRNLWRRPRHEGHSASEEEEEEILLNQSILRAWSCKIYKI